MDTTIDKMLLHICCGPCSMFVIDDLKAYFEGIELFGYYANPNIHPFDEFMRRLENCQKACNIKEIPLDYLLEFDMEKWQNFDGPIEERCKMCYKTRMELAAKYAKEHDFKYFSTTLLVSPYQNHDEIKKAGTLAGEKYGVEFFYRDYSVGFREGQKQAKDAGLYRQKYCGCIKSKDRK